MKLVCMILKHTVIVCLCLFPVFSLGKESENKLEQLQQIWQADIREDLKLSTVIEIIEENNASKLSPEWIDTVLHYASLAQQLASDRKDKRAEARALRVLGKINYFDVNNYQDARAYFTQAISLLRTESALDLKADLFNQLGNVQRRLANYLEAVEAFQQAIELIESQARLDASTERTLGKLYSNIGLIYKEMELLDKAKAYYLQSLACAKRRNNQAGIAFAYNNLVPVLRDKGDLKSAKIYLDSTYTLFAQKKVDSSFIYLKGDAHVLGGTIARAKQDYRKVIQENRSAIEIYETQADSFFMAKSYNNLGEALALLNDNDEAISAYSQGLGLIQHTENYEMLQILNAGIAAVLIEEGAYKQALAYQLKSQEAHEHIYNKQLIVTALDQQDKLTQQFEDEKRKFEVEKAIIQANIKAKENLYTMGLGALGLISVLALFSVRSHRLKKNALEKRNQLIEQNLAHKDEIHRQMIVDLLKDQELDINAAIIEGQDQERNRISGELHDGVAGVLAGSKKLMEHLVKKLKIKGDFAFQDLSEEIIELIDTAYNVTHNLSEDLASSSVMCSLGEFAANIHALTEKLRKLDIKTDVQIAGKSSHKLKSAVSFNLSRIAQEAFTNIIKYANASHVSVRINLDANGLAMMIEDDGTGFDVDTVKKGLGLDSMLKRIKKIEGKLEIDSKPDHGTRIIASLIAPELAIA